jgi:hydrogenase nickel incorporation protein HypA/HybF
MHEMSLALEIREICVRELESQPETHLTALGLEAGAFSGVEIDTLQFCLEVVMSERFDGVTCDVVRVAGVAVCLACGEEFDVCRAPFECPQCGGVARGVSGGGDLRVTYIEVE